MGPDALDVADRIAGAIGLSLAAYVLEETFWAIRRLLQMLGGGRPPSW